ncbi:MAG: hypothetical protein ACRDNG_09350, partial [Gaiellaceae bacterium]
VGRNPSTHVGWLRMAPRVDIEDLIDARGVAEILGLAQRNTVSLYQRRYPDMPRPALDLGPSRTKLWLRSEIASWASKHAKRGGRRSRR